MVTVSALALLASMLGACRSTNDASASAGDGARAGGSDTEARVQAVDTKPDATRPRLLLTDTPSGAGSVSPYLIGGNQRWLKSADGVWSGEDKPNPRITALSKRIGVRSVRYPGGTVANMFDYTKMTHAEPTGCQTSAGFAAGFFTGIGVPQTQYTIPRHSAFMASLPSNARTSLMVPMVNASPADAVGFVKAMVAASDKATKAAHGQNAKGQRVWNVEIGNEPYLPNQRYWRSADKGKRLQQYIHGGYGHQPRYAKDDDYRGNQGLYPADQCRLKPKKDRSLPVGEAGTYTYRVRFGPIATGAGRRPTVTVGKTEFTRVDHLGDKHGHVFTTRGGTVEFPKGTDLAGKKLKIDYWAGREPGFVDFYRKLQHYDATHDGVRINVCSSWAKPEFVAAMQDLANKTGGKKGRYDCLAVHSYSSPDADGLAGTHKQLNAAAHRLGGTLSDLRSGMRSDAVPGAGKRFLIVTEYGTLNLGYAKARRMFAYDLYLAQLNMGQIRHGVRAATVSNFGSLFSKVDGRYRLTGRARVQRLYARMVGQRPMQTKTAAKDNVWILGTKGDKGNRHLMVVNARGSGGLHRNVAVAGADRDRCVVSRTYSARLGAQTVPTDEHPNVPTTHTSTKTWKSGTQLGIAVPAHTITLYTISRKGGASCG